jgi:hypothetical protein
MLVSTSDAPAADWMLLWVIKRISKLAKADIGSAVTSSAGMVTRLMGLEIDDGRSLLNVEPHALRERKLHSEIDRVGGPTHIGLPHVGAGLATAAGLLLAAKGAPDLGS